METWKQKILSVMKYYANMSVNNGTHYRPALEGTNYRKLASEISKSARENCFIGSTYSWTVWDENRVIVAAGAGRATNSGFSYSDCSHLIGERL